MKQSGEHVKPEGPAQEPQCVCGHNEATHAVQVSTSGSRLHGCYVCSDCDHFVPATSAPSQPAGEHAAAREVLAYINRHYGGNPMYDSTWVDGLAEIIARHYAAHVRQEWIPVSERLPEKHLQGVLCLSQIGPFQEQEVACWYGGRFNRVHTVDVSPLHSVTHWRPLPAAPEAHHG